jgi:hypothetical protein
MEEPWDSSQGRKTKFCSRFHCIQGKRKFRFSSLIHHLSPPVFLFFELIDRNCRPSTILIEEKKNTIKIRIEHVFHLFYE